MIIRKKEPVTTWVTTCLSPQSEDERRRKVGQIPRLCQTFQKAVQQESDSKTTHIRNPWNSPQETGKETR